MLKKDINRVLVGKTIKRVNTYRIQTSCGDFMTAISSLDMTDGTRLALDACESESGDVYPIRVIKGGDWK